MSDPTPSPRPAALVEAMAAYQPLHDELAEFVRELCGPTEIVNAVICAAQAQGFVLIPRAELEEAANVIDWAISDGPTPLAEYHTELQAKLRQRSRG